MIKIFENYVRQIIQEELECKFQLFPQAVKKIDKNLANYNEVKIGKTSNIDDRFDSYYKNDGYVELIPIIKCPNKKMMDILEKELITHYGNRVSNSQVGGGNKNYSNDYWIYIVVK